MGRKIAKSKKHKKIKSVDPTFVGPTTKEDKRSNRGPGDINVQEVPRKMRELFEWRNNPIKKHKKKKTDKIVVKLDKLEETQSGMNKSIKKVPNVMAQRPAESDYRFVSRIQKVVDQQISETKMEIKYGIDETDDKELLAEAKGESTVKRTNKQEKNRLFAQKQRLKQKKRKEDNIDEYDNLTDKVEFGEVALQPPDLKFAPRLIKVKPTVQPGKRSLLLKQQLPTEVQQGLSNTGLNRNTQLTGKRKDLSLFQRARLENERVQAVNLYRQIKLVRNKEKVKNKPITKY